MYAIVKTGGKQYRVQQGQRVRVEKLEGVVGSTVDLTEVLAVGEGDSLKVGKPTVAGAKVTATIKVQDRDKKLIVFMKRRRKGYQKKRGHRQSYTELEIQAINA